MVEKGILFKAEMVRAILAGKKTQTRRQPHRPWERTPKPKFSKGDLLYVREAWAVKDGEYIYRADGDREGVKWRSSLYMLKKAARIWLEVVGVRSLLLQEISESDAAAEGTTKLDGKTFKESFAMLWDSINAERGYAWSDLQYVLVYDFKVLKEISNN